MAQVLVRDLDEKTVKRLKARAEENGRSLQSEVKAILEQAAAEKTAAERGRIIAKWQRHFAGRHFEDSAELIRADRER
jgi:antitoxin FitA